MKSNEITGIQHWQPWATGAIHLSVERAGHILTVCTLIGDHTHCISVYKSLFVCVKTTHCFAHKAIDYKFYNIKWEMIYIFTGVRPAQTVYFKQICKCDDTAVNVHLTPRHITDLELLTWTWNKQSHCSKFSLPQGILFIITSSRQRGFAHGIASFMRRHCVFIFLFIYLHLLYRVFEKEGKKKNPRFWGKLRSCTKCSGKQTGWNI